MFLKRKDKLFDPSEQQWANFTTFFSFLWEGSLSSPSQSQLWEPRGRARSQCNYKGTAATGVTDLRADSRARWAERISSMGSLEMKLKNGNTSSVNVTVKYIQRQAPKDINPATTKAVDKKPGVNWQKEKKKNQNNHSETHFSGSLKYRKSTYVWMYFYVS